MAVNDSPGFVSNRVLMPLINEAAFGVMEGVATAEAVDAVMKLGMNHPMGPLELADFIGLDVCVDIMDVLHEGFGDPKYRACPLLRKMVAAGWLGKKRPGILWVFRLNSRGKCTMRPGVRGTYRQLQNRISSGRRVCRDGSARSDPRACGRGDMRR